MCIRDSFGVCTAYFSVDANRRLLLHGVCDMAVYVQRGFCADMAYHGGQRLDAVSYTHLRAHETVLDLVCRLLLEKKKITI